MHTLAGGLLVGGDFSWQANIDPHREDGLRVCFFAYGGGVDVERSVLKRVRDAISRNGISWISPGRDAWAMDVDGLRAFYKRQFADDHFAQGFDWLRGVITVTPQVKHHYGVANLSGAPIPSHTDVWLDIYREDYELNQPSMLFLSHKGADKPLVTQYFDTLKLLGFDPWLDEDAMPAGTKLHRGIQQGFKDSCAAVFFITPQFKDESYLKKEIDYAIAEENERPDRFKIVTLVFTDEQGNKGVVPKLLVIDYRLMR